MKEKDPRPPIFIEDDIYGDVAFLRNWEEFKRILGGIQEQIERLQEKIDQKNLDKEE